MTVVWLKLSKKEANVWRDPYTEPKWIKLLFLSYLIHRDFFYLFTLYFKRKEIVFKLRPVSLKTNEKRR
jgi:hypothetical protein